MFRLAVVCSVALLGCDEGRAIVSDLPVDLGGVDVGEVDTATTVDAASQDAPAMDLGGRDAQAVDSGGDVGDVGIQWKCACPAGTFCYDPGNTCSANEFCKEDFVRVPYPLPPSGMCPSWCEDWSMQGGCLCPGYSCHALPNGCSDCGCLSDPCNGNNSFSCSKQSNGLVYVTCYYGP